MPRIDVVVVTYNSRDRLRETVAPLVSADDLHVIVVDNASPDGTLGAIEDLPATTVPLAQNSGFAYGCNRGIENGSAPYVLLLNPDARIAAADVLALARTLERAPGAGAVAPRIVDEDRRLDHSLRRFPRLRSTFARAVFLHRVFPRATWVDEVIRDASVYTEASDVEWASGACLLLRRTAVESLGGLDESFFMYCEDTDLCRRLWDNGWAVRFEPAAVVTHAGGASAPRASLLPVLAASRRRYAEKHRSGPAAFLERIGIALEAAIRIALTRDGSRARRGHLRALGKALRTVSEAT